MIPGGKGANQACAAGKLGAGSVVVRMIGRVGYDVFADHLKASLSAAGVDVSAVHAAQVAAHRRRADLGGPARPEFDRGGFRRECRVGRRRRGGHAAGVPGRNLALFQLETPLDTVAAALKLAREEGLQTILDPAPAQPLPRELLALVDILTPNESEALMLLGRPPARVSPEDAPELRRRWPGLDRQTVILKLGDQGCFCGGRHHPSFPVQVRDTTAAGDTFNAALAIALAEDKPLPDAIRFANAAAGISVTRLGAQASAPTRMEVEALL